MLITFRFENFLSFKKSTSIDFEAASIRELPENTFPVSTQSIETRLLKSLAIYGANASGKSNIIKAFLFARNFILQSSNNNATNVKLEPYRLDIDSEKKPTLFDITILIEGIKYRYGFALTADVIVSEWLYITEKRKEELLFRRDEHDFQIEKKFKQEAEGSIVMLSKITKPNVLFLSSLGQFKSDTAQKILGWFNKTIVVLDSGNQRLLNYTARLLNDSYFKRRIVDIISKSDLSFSSVEAEKKERMAKLGYDEGFVAALYENETDYRIKTHHTKYLNQKTTGYTYFDLTENESLGSQKFVMLLGPILKTLNDASVIWIDELDARLHTNLLLFVLRFFNSALNNSKGGQIVYTSHNNSILEKDLRRDQMLFVKRDQYEGSLVTTLHNWNPKIRSDASFDKDYLKGKYGAVPRIDLSPNLFDEVM